MSDYYTNQPTRQDATRRRRYADSARKQWYAKHRAERWRVHYFGEIGIVSETLLGEETVATLPGSLGLHLCSHSPEMTES